MPGSRYAQAWNANWPACNLQAVRALHARRALRAALALPSFGPVRVSAGMAGFAVEPALQPKPTAAERPMRAVQVAIGARVCVCTRGRFRWYAKRVGRWKYYEYVQDGQAFRGWTDVVIERVLVRDETQKVVLTPQVGLDRCRQPRLRVFVDGKYRQMSHVVSFCWHRPTLSHLSWADFAKGLGQGHKKGLYEADHLPFERADGGLGTREDVCGAGWVEAVTVQEHSRRTKAYREAVHLFERVLELEQEQERERAAWARLKQRAQAARPAKRRRTLGDLGGDSTTKPSAQRLRTGADFARLTPPFCRLTWDIQWDPPAGSDENDPGANGLVHYLFVQAHGSDPDAATIGLEPEGLVHKGGAPSKQKRAALTPRQALIAFCIRESRLQRAAALSDGPGA